MNTLVPASTPYSRCPITEIVDLDQGSPLFVYGSLSYADDICSARLHTRAGTLPAFCLQVTIAMEILIVGGIAALVTAIITAGVYVTCQRMSTYCTLEAMRDELATRVCKTRLGKLLQSLNIRLQDYVREFPAATVNSHIRICNNCESWRACDAWLSGSSNNPGALRKFCPNLSQFDNLIRTPAGNRAGK